MQTYTKKIITWLMAITLLIGTILVDYRVPLSTKANEGIDVTGKVHVKLWNFWVEVGNGREYIIEEGRKQGTMPQIKKGHELYLEYQWDVPTENMHFIRGGNYFDIQLPDQSLLKSGVGTYPIYDKGKPETPENLIGTFTINNNGRLRTTFSKSFDFDSINILEEGLLKVYAKVLQGGENIDVIKDFQDGTKITIEVIPENPNDSDDDSSNPPPTVNPDNFPPMRKDKQKPIHKWGTHKKDENKLHYALAVNRKQYYNIYDTPPQISTKNNFYLIDELPAGLEIVPSSIDIGVPFFPPAMGVESGKTLVYGVPSSTEVLAGWTDYDRDFMLGGKRFFSLDECNDPNKPWETYRDEIKARNGRIIGVWNKSKLIMTFGNLPDENYKYDDCFQNLAGEIDKLKTVNNGTRINDIQAKLMKEAHIGKAIIYYNVFFDTVITGTVKKEYTNKANIYWNTGETAKAESKVEILNAGGTVTPKKFTGDIEVVKKWNGKEGEEVTVVLVEDGVESNKTLTLNEASQWRGKFTGLPEFKHSNQKIQYSIKELNVDGYKTEIKEDSKKYKFVITNTELTKIPVKKEWIGNSENEVLPEITVQLFKKGSDDVIDTLTLNKDGNWKGEFKGLPKYDKEGQEIEYIVKETSVPVDYTVKVERDAKNGFIVINTKSKINIPVEKQWVGLGNNEAAPEVTVELWANGQKTGKTLKLNQDNNWKGIFENLDVNKNGSPINYSIAEVSVKDYVTEIKRKDSNDITKGVLIVNTKVPKITIEVDKKWVRENRDELPKNHKSIPDSIVVELVKKGLVDEVVDTKTLTKAGEWKGTFDSVPSKDSKGNLIKYVVREKETVKGFSLAAPMNVEHNKATLTNILTDKTVSITIDKKWMKGNTKLTNVTEDKVVVDILFRKKGSGEGFKDYKTGLEIKKSENWTLTVSGLPELDVDGNELEYDVREAAVPNGYYASKAGGPKNFILTNTLIPKREIKVVKKWLGEDGNELGSDYLRIPARIKVKLWKKVGTNGVWTDTGDVLTLTKAGNWKGSFADLDTVDYLGNSITYRIEEVQGTAEFANEFINEGTKAEIANGTVEIVITNKKTKETVEIKVYKKWLDLNSSSITDQNRLPDGVKFSLFADGQFKKAFMVSKANGWYYTESLPKFDANGKEIVYTIKEAGLYGYTVTIQKENGALSFTATNKETPTPPNPFIPPLIPDEPVPTPPNTPTPPAPNVPTEELVIEDDAVVLADNEEPEPEEPEEEQPDEEITDDLPKQHKEVPKTADYLMDGFANPLAVGTVMMLGYGIKKMIQNKKNKK